MMTKRQAGYTLQSKGKKCVNCATFTNDGKTGSCSIVAGEILPRATCDFWLRAG